MKDPYNAIRGKWSRMNREWLWLDSFVVNWSRPKCLLLRFTSSSSYINYTSDAVYIEICLFSTQSHTSALSRHILLRGVPLLITYYLLLLLYYFLLVIILSIIDSNITYYAYCLSFISLYFPTTYHPTKCYFNHF